ncbi:MAG: uridine phosphorylase [Oscillospiraceae bacterium]|nr:uridine phosphorylase [Oscillospiraceae bacterium]
MSEKLYHIGLSKEELEGARYAIIAGDPGRIPSIASSFDSPRALASNREYTSWLGKLEGKSVVAISHGIGGPSTAICIEELYQLGVDTFIRVGTSGGMSLDVLAGDAVIAAGAIRAEGTSREYLPIEFPAIADFEVTQALKEAADKLGARSHVGVVQCKDSFYGQHSPERMPVAGDLLYKWEAWIRGGALASEMETAAEFTVCSCLRARAGAVLLAVWNQEREKAGLDSRQEAQVHDSSLTINIALEAVKILMKRDA